MGFFDLPSDPTARKRTKTPKKKATRGKRRTAKRATRVSRKKAPARIKKVTKRRSATARWEPRELRLADGELLSGAEVLQPAALLAVARCKRPEHKQKSVCLIHVPTGGLLMPAPPGKGQVARVKRLALEVQKDADWGSARVLRTAARVLSGQPAPAWWNKLGEQIRVAYYRSLRG